MPGFHIHLAIGNRYIEKHTIEDKESFLWGIIAPDFTDNKDKTHYTKPTKPNSSIIEFSKNKVCIEDFLKENEVKTDYEKGVFLHLLTDKIFFNEFFPKEYLEKENYVQFCKNLYTSYEMTNPYIAKKYNIKFSKELLEKIKQNIEDNSKKKHIEGKVGHNIIPIDKLEEFIEKMSDISIEDYLKKYSKWDVIHLWRC